MSINALLSKQIFDGLQSRFGPGFLTAENARIQWPIILDAARAAGVDMNTSRPFAASDGGLIHNFTSTGKLDDDAHVKPTIYVSITKRLHFE